LIVAHGEQSGHASHDPEVGSDLISGKDLMPPSNPLVNARESLDPAGEACQYL
jgi:hypothetical protein